MSKNFDDQVRKFSNDLTLIVKSLWPQSPDFIAEFPEDVSHEVIPALVKTRDSAPIYLSVDGLRLLDLLVEYQCTLSDRHAYMTIQKSSFRVRPHDGGEWLFRMEYINKPRSAVPCAHLHVHAHRDAWTFIMSRDGVGSGRRLVKRRGSVGKTPQLSDIHFPLGGPRLRPSLEDFLTMLIQDLGVDHEPQGRKVLDKSREQWRTNQARAIVGSAQDIAADVLRGYGWKVTPPAGYQAHTDPPKWMTLH